jgi:hypothetical protein
LKEINEVKKNSTIEMLRTHFQFKEEHFLAIKIILDNPDNLDKLNYKLIDLNEVIQTKKHTSERIAAVPNYIVSSVLNYFK